MELELPIVLVAVELGLPIDLAAERELPIVLVGPELELPIDLAAALEQVLVLAVVVPVPGLAQRSCRGPVGTEHHEGPEKAEQQNDPTEAHGQPREGWGCSTSLRGWARKGMRPCVDGHRHDHRRSG